MIEEILFEVQEGQKRYGSKLVLALEGLQLKSGDRCVILGENGCGKSTLLRVIAGLTFLDQGIWHRSNRWSNISVAYLPQDGGIYRDLTVEENRETFQRLFGLRRGQTTAHDIAERLGIADVVGKLVGELSGGFRRLAALYCFMSVRPNVLILDEPFASLDDAKQSAVQTTLHDLRSDYLLLIASQHTKDGHEISEDSLWSRSFHLNRPLSHATFKA